MARVVKAKVAPVAGTWDPVAVYGAAGRLSDAGLIRWVLEREARVFAHGAERMRTGAYGRYAKPDPAAAAAEQLLADRLTEIANRVECFASTTQPIADALTG